MEKVKNIYMQTAAVVVKGWSWIEKFVKSNSILGTNFLVYISTIPGFVQQAKYNKYISVFLHL